MMGLSAAVTTPFLPRMVNLFGQIPVLRVSLVTLPLAILALPIFQNLYAWFLAIHHRIVCNSHLGFLKYGSIHLQKMGTRGRIIAIYTVSFRLIHHWCFDHHLHQLRHLRILYFCFVGNSVALPLWSMKDIGDFEAPMNISFKISFFFTHTHGSSWMMGFSCC